MPHNITKPYSLKHGDFIGIIAPSEPLDDSRIQRLISSEMLLNNMGYEVCYGENLYNAEYYMAGTPMDRLSDLHYMIKSDHVKAIMTAWGGKSANQLIDLIDYDLIKHNPKIISGFSDTTNLINAIYAMTGLVTFHGPNVVGKLSEGGITDIHFMQRAFVTGEIGALPCQNANIIRPGIAKGVLIGGNLTCFTLGVAGTPYLPKARKVIFFWESGSRTPQEIDQYLTYLRLCGLFKKVAGMIIGDTSGCKDERNWGNRSIKDIVLAVTSDYNFPIMQIPIFGHGGNINVTLPIGCKAEISTEPPKFIISGKCITNRERIN